jgi:uncharacterized damage-inducible protein DinB
MSHSPAQPLLEALLDSWDRNNTITINLLRAIADDAMDLKPIDSSPSIAQLFAHMDYCRLIFVLEDAPEFAREMRNGQWNAERDRERLAWMFTDSAAAVRDAVRHRIETGREMQIHYDHPLLMLQHLIWHEGYHQGQIKLTLKLAGRPLIDDEVGLVTWDIWMNKTARSVSQ